MSRSVPYQAGASIDESNSVCWNGLHFGPDWSIPLGGVVLVLTSKVSLFEFFKTFHEHRQCPMNPDHPHSIESNSACWNVLHPVFPSNFTNKSFRFLEQSGWFYKYAFSHMSLWNPESLSPNAPSPWEEFDRKHLNEATEWRIKPAARSGFALARAWW